MFIINRINLRLHLFFDIHKNPRAIYITRKSVTSLIHKTLKIKRIVSIIFKTIHIHYNNITIVI
jgi:hypothetical protein